MKGKPCERKYSRVERGRAAYTIRRLRTIWERGRNGRSHSRNQIRTAQHEKTQRGSVKGSDAIVAPENATYEEGHFVAHVQLYFVGQWGGFGEIAQVF